MGVGAGLYMCDLVKKFTFAISSPDEFLLFFALMESVWNLLRNPYDITHLTLGVLHYLGKLKIKFSADVEENANVLHF